MHFILLTIVLTAAGLAATRMTAAELEPVRIDAGLILGVSGEHDPGVRVFKGVPFAAPPVGPLRWKPPAPVQHWDNVRRADRFSAVCPQPPRTGNFALAGTSQRLGAAAEDLPLPQFMDCRKIEWRKASCDGVVSRRRFHDWWWQRACLRRRSSGPQGRCRGDDELSIRHPRFSRAS